MRTPMAALMAANSSQCFKLAMTSEFARRPAPRLRNPLSLLKLNLLTQNARLQRCSRSLIKMAMILSMRRNSRRLWPRALRKGASALRRQSFVLQSNSYSPRGMVPKEPCLFFFSGKDGGRRATSLSLKGVVSSPFHEVYRNLHGPCHPFSQWEGG